jgi:hypothetical protein
MRAIGNEVHGYIVTFKTFFFILNVLITRLVEMDKSFSAYGRSTLMMLWLVLALAGPIFCNAAAEQHGASTPYSGLSLIESWDGIEEAIEIIFGGPLWYSDEQLRQGIAEYSCRLSQLAPDSREYGLVLVQRAMCYQALSDTNAAKEDLDLALANPNAIRCRSENGFLILTNLPPAERDVDRIFAELNLCGYLGTRDDVELVDGSTVYVRDLGFSSLDGIDQELQTCEEGCSGFGSRSLSCFLNSASVRAVSSDAN